MKKVSLYLFAVLALFTVATSCKKDKHNPDEVVVIPQTEIPDEFVGKWIIGNVNPAHFSDFSGDREDDMVNTIAYNLKKDGSAEQFIYIYEEDAHKQTLTFRKGKVTYDDATKTLKFNPTEGRYRIFENGDKTEDDMTDAGLYPKYTPSYRNCSIEEDDNVKYLVGKNDYNETVGFAKVNW